MDEKALLAESFKKVFESMDKVAVKKGVDEMGIDKYISHCALLAGATGAASGLAGGASLIIGLPVDIINNVVQQFRVTLGVIYHKKGVYKISFTDFMKIVGVSLGVEVGASLSKAVMIRIAIAILARLSGSTALRLLPLVGAVIGGTANYGFIKFIGVAVKKIDMSNFTFEEESEPVKPE